MFLGPSLCDFVVMGFKRLFWFALCMLAFVSVGGGLGVRRFVVTSLLCFAYE